MGLPGSGKTTLANELAPLLNAKRLNADEVRREASDWDFSEEGRKRQAKRMADFALKLRKDNNYVVADFICPTPEARSLFPSDYVIWVDTIKEGGLMILIRCLSNQTSITFMLPHKMLKIGHQKYIRI